MARRKNNRSNFKNRAASVYSWLLRFLPKRPVLRKVVIVALSALIVFVGINYAVARWYIASQANKPLQLGATFIPDYAERMGLNPKETMQAMIDDLGIKRLRLVSYWRNIEPSPGNYDFSKLDWQFKKANQNGVKISLAIGLRQPRWPECHAPDWAKSMPMDQWYPPLKAYMKKTIERYKNNPALESYQLENEFFMTVFGICPDHSRSRLEDEFKFVKSIDSTHPVVISRSNNWIGIPIGQPRPDEFGISVYKRVWDKTITKRYFEYPLPAWFYAMLAGWGKIFTGKNMIIHELQAEPWPPNGVLDDSPEELNKSLDAKRLKDRFSYGKATGMRTIDLWGAEYWYYRKVKLHDDSLWRVAQQEYSKSK